MTTGIIAAMPAELAGLTRKRPAAGRWLPTEGGLWVAVSGMGPTQARAIGEQLIAHGADALISWGCATALSRHLQPGQLVAPLHIIAPDGGRLPVTAEWHERLITRLSRYIPIETGDLAASPHVLDTPQAKARLRYQTGALAADMESLALGHLAAQHQIPFLVLRAIADTAASSIPAFVQQAPDASWGQFPLLWQVARHPHAWPALMQLGRQFNAAQTTLTQIALHGLPQLHGVPPPLSDARTAGEAG